MEMSWSFYGVGKPPAVLAKARKDLAAVKCMEPEETIKTGVLGILEVSLSNYPADAAVRVRAQGSQNVDSSKPGAANTLTVEIENLYGFVE
jgi:hypothetical protein